MAVAVVRSSVGCCMVPDSSDMGLGVGQAFEGVGKVTGKGPERRVVGSCIVGASIDGLEK